MLKTKIPTLEEDTLKRLDRDQLVNIGLEQNALLLEQAKVINDLLLQVKELRSQVATLQKNSTNSSKPPSTDLTGTSSSNRKHLNSRKASGRKSGGQPGHRGSTREMVANPDRIITHITEHCENCGKSLTDRESTEQIIARFQIVDIPPIVPLVTE